MLITVYALCVHGHAALAGRPFAGPLPYAFRASRIAGPACCPAALISLACAAGLAPIHTGVKYNQTASRFVLGRLRAAGIS